MANTHNLQVADVALDLNNIRSALRRMEDSIIFSLIERAQFPTMGTIYEPRSNLLGEFKLHALQCAGSNGCYSDYFLYQTECAHSEARRYLHPTEFSFFSPLPEPMGGGAKSSQREEQVLAPHNVNENTKLLALYRTKIIPEICERGDDGNYGSAAVQDVQCLQTIATRIYYGLFVAESKFRSEPEFFTDLIKHRDEQGLMDAITKPAVEAKIIERVVLKARTFSQDLTGDAEADSKESYKLDPEFVGKVFEQYIMPLTKDVEVQYLLERLAPEGPP